MIDVDNYRISIQRRQTEDGLLYVATVAEFPDVAVYSETRAEAYAEVIDVIQGLCELFEKQGLELPAPFEPLTYSGKFLVRVPKSLHRYLAETADAEGVSLNQYVVSVLSASFAFVSTNGREVAADAETADESAALAVTLSEPNALPSSGASRGHLKLIAGGRE
jgi:antitoxin HicB